MVSLPCVMVSLCVSTISLTVELSLLFDIASWTIISSGPEDVSLSTLGKSLSLPKVVHLLHKL